MWQARIYWFMLQVANSKWITFVYYYFQEKMEDSPESIKLKGPKDL